MMLKRTRCVVLVEQFIFNANKTIAVNGPSMILLC